jgi:ATPase family associated with various cellular activities (AAA)
VGSDGIVMSESLRTVVAVAGDQMADWQIIGGNAAEPAFDIEWVWQAGAPFQLAAEPIGAEPLGALLQALLAGAGGRDVQVLRQPLPAGTTTDPSLDRILRSLSYWTPMPAAHGEGAGAWRVARMVGRAPASGEPRGKPLTACDVSAGAPSVVALIDLDMGFRHDAARWRDLLAGEPGVYLRATDPLGEGELWQELVARHRDRLTVVIDGTDLRRASLQVEQPLSWEHIYDRAVAAVRSSPLAEAHVVVVTLGLTGAVLVGPGQGATLIFDPHALAATSARFGAGFVWGHQMVMLSALLGSSLGLWPGPVEAVLAGLHGMRALHRGGFVLEGEPGHQRLRFPLDRVAAALVETPTDLSVVELGDEQRATSSILLQTMGAGQLEETARRVARLGPSGLSDVPIETVGAWSSVDRAEIENMRSLRGIMAEYVDAYRAGRRVKRPLSVAVFGPPGAGKSFAVKQVAKALLPGQLEVLEFNLSQFAGEQRLPGAFHAARDATLRQQLPLVFWDEFDTALAGMPLGWLRHFLAPMQDGEFVEGEATHPLGPAIFVFAGGTSASFVEFAAGGDHEARYAKKSDFISRLRGSMDVLGPNPAGPADAAVILRRALLLHALLRQSVPQIFTGDRLNIDEGVLRAFLHVDSFRHGARSMEAIVDVSALTGKASYERASLPAPSQLTLHVDAEAFLKLVAEEPEAV